MNVIPQSAKDTFTRLLGPLVRVLVRAGVHPNLITTTGTLIVIGAGVAFGFGEIRLGGALLLFAGLFDVLDGQIARQGGMATTFGAFYDSTLDRVGEFAVFAGLAIYFERGGVPAARETLAVGLALGALAMSMLVSYTRARAEGLELECRVGIATRAGILLLAAAALLFGPGRNGALLFWIVALLALAATITVVQRVLYVRRIAGTAPRPMIRRETLPGVAASRRRGH